MKKFLLIPRVSPMIKLDTDTQGVTQLNYITNRIDWIYQVDEDGQVSYSSDSYKITKDVKKGDIVIKFYEQYSDVENFNPIVVIDNEDWKNNIESLNRAALKRAEQTNLNNYDEEISGCGKSAAQ